MRRRDAATTDEALRPDIDAALSHTTRRPRTSVLRTISGLVRDDEEVECILRGTCSLLPFVNYDSVLVVTNRRLFVVKTHPWGRANLDRDIPFETVSYVEVRGGWRDWWATAFKNPEIEQVDLFASGRKVRTFVPAPDAREIVELLRGHTRNPS